MSAYNKTVVILSSKGESKTVKRQEWEKSLIDVYKMHSMFINENKSEHSSMLYIQLIIRKQN